MALDREYPHSFTKEGSPILDYEAVVSRMKKEENSDVIKAELAKYKAINIGELSAEQYQKHAKITRYLERKIEREDPETLIKQDTKYLSEKYGDKFNV